jgi:hypothetical protein
VRCRLMKRLGGGSFPPVFHFIISPLSSSLLCSQRAHEIGFRAPARLPREPRRHCLPPHRKQVGDCARRPHGEASGSREKDPARDRPRVRGSRIIDLRGSGRRARRMSVKAPPETPPEPRQPVLTRVVAIPQRGYRCAFDHRATSASGVGAGPALPTQHDDPGLRVSITVISRTTWHAMMRQCAGQSGSWAP